MKKMLIIILGSCFIAAPLIGAVPEQKPSQAKTATCKCDPCTCNPCLCTNDSCNKSKEQKAECYAKVIKAADEKKCSSANK